MKKTILFFVSVILFTTVAFSQQKDTGNINVQVNNNIPPGPYIPQYIPQQQTNLLQNQPKTFTDLLRSIQDDMYRYKYGSNYGSSGYYGMNYSQMNYLMSLRQVSPNAGTELCSTCFDYSPEIQPYETLVATLKVSELGDTAKINTIQKQYQYFRIGKKVYNMYGVLLTDSVPIFARMQDKVVEPIRIKMPSTRTERW